MITNPYQFKRWLETARKGAKCIYHIGFLMQDRDYTYNPLDYAKVHAMAVTAWNAYEKRLCTLAQRRVGDGSYEYMAIKQATPTPSVV